MFLLVWGQYEIEFKLSVQELDRGLNHGSGRTHFAVGLTPILKGDRFACPPIYPSCKGWHSRHSRRLKHRFPERLFAVLRRLRYRTLSLKRPGIFRLDLWQKSKSNKYGY